MFYLLTREELFHICWAAKASFLAKQSHPGQLKWWIVMVRPTDWGLSSQQSTTMVVYTRNWSQTHKVHIPQSHHRSDSPPREHLRHDAICCLLLPENVLNGFWYCTLHVQWVRSCHMLNIPSQKTPVDMRTVNTIPVGFRIFHDISEWNIVEPGHCRVQ